MLFSCAARHRYFTASVIPAKLALASASRNPGLVSRFRGKDLSHSRYKHAVHRSPTLASGVLIFGLLIALVWIGEVIGRRFGVQEQI